MIPCQHDSTIPLLSKKGRRLTSASSGIPSQSQNMRSLINRAKLFVSLQPNVLPCRLKGEDQDEHNFEAVQSCPEFENEP